MDFGTRCNSWQPFSRAWKDGIWMDPAFVYQEEQMIPDLAPAVP